MPLYRPGRFGDPDWQWRARPSISGQGEPPNDPRFRMVGATGDNFTTTVGNVAGNLDIAVLVAFRDWSPTGSMNMVSKGIAADFGYIFRLNSSGFIELGTSTDGSTIVTPTATTKLMSQLVPDGQAAWVRVTRSSVTGSTDFFWAPYQGYKVVPTVWQVVTPNRSSTAAPLFASSQLLTIGSNSTGLSNMLDGLLYRAIVKDAGVVVADWSAADASPFPAIATPVRAWYSSDIVGEIWTPHGTMALELPSVDIVSGAPLGIGVDTEAVIDAAAPGDVAVVGTCSIAVSSTSEVAHDAIVLGTEAVAETSPALVGHDAEVVASELLAVSTPAAVLVVWAVTGSEQIGVAESAAVLHSATVTASEGIGVADPASVTHDPTIVSSEGVGVAETATVSHNATVVASELAAGDPSSVLTHVLTGTGSEGIGTTVPATAGHDATVVGSELLAVAESAVITDASSVAIVATCSIGVASSSLVSRDASVSATESVAGNNLATVAQTRPAVATASVAVAPSSLSAVDRAIQAILDGAVATTCFPPFVVPVRTQKGGAYRAPLRRRKPVTPEPERVIKIGYDEISDDTALVDIYAGAPGPEVEPFVHVDSESDILLMLF